ncbi:MAG: lipoprotein-releasing system ATP-binding protein [Clostridiales bacterium]|nr:lipoprotein-releasing system ATP-binding protein [Clostridiales bacterium]
MNSVITLNHVNKIYGTEIKNQVLHDIDLTFEEGTFNSIIGQSGSGKSTLLNIIGTLDKATSGDVLIQGKNVSEMTKNQLADYRNKTIGFVFQFHYLLPEFTALQNVLMPYLIQHGKASKEATQRAEELLHIVGLDKVKNNMATKMSGGQQQRTAIARSLINQPKIILADEPTGNLDSDSTESIYELLRNINEEMKTTFIIITHDRRIAEKADRIVEIKDGRVHLDFAR